METTTNLDITPVVEFRELTCLRDVHPEQLKQDILGFFKEHLQGHGTFLGNTIPLGVIAKTLPLLPGGIVMQTPTFKMIYPQACGALSHIGQFEAVLASPDDGTWRNVFGKGFPWLYYRIVEGQVQLTDYFPHFPMDPKRIPESEVKVNISVMHYAKAVNKAKKELHEFEKRVKEVLTPMVKRKELKHASQQMIYGKRA